MRQPEKRAAKSSLKAQLVLSGCFGVRVFEKRRQLEWKVRLLSEA